MVHGTSWSTWRGKSYFLSTQVQLLVVLYEIVPHSGEIGMYTNDKLRHCAGLVNKSMQRVTSQYCNRAVVPRLTAQRDRQWFPVIAGVQGRLHKSRYDFRTLSAAKKKRPFPPIGHTTTQGATNAVDPMTVRRIEFPYSLLVFVRACSLRWRRGSPLAAAWPVFFILF